MRIVIHGNCQSGAISFLIKEIFPNWDIYSLQVHNCLVNEATKLDYKLRVSQADIILYQPVSDNYRDTYFLGRSFIEENSNPSTKLIIYPSIYYYGYMQGYGTVRDSKGHLLSYQDTDPLLPVIYGIISGHDEKIILDHLLDPDLISNEAVIAFHRKCIDELARREKQADILVPVTPYVEENRFSRKLFHTYNHHIEAYLYIC